MLQGVLAYIICALILYWIQVRTDSTVLRGNWNNRLVSTDVLPTVIVFGVFYGIRYNTGSDNLSYIRFYENLKNWGWKPREDIEPTYVFIQDIFASFDLHYSIFIGFWGALQMGLLLYATRDYRYIWPFLVPFVVLGPFFLEMANIMRQTTALCIFMIVIEYGVDRQFVKYIIGIVVCMLFHKSAIILLPLYFLFKNPIVPNNRIMAVAIFIICTLVGNNAFWIEYLLEFKGFLIMLNYEHYANSIEEIIQTSNWSIEWGPGRTLSWLMMLLTIWFYYTLIRNVKDDKRVKCYFFCFYYGQCLYNILINTDQIFIRPIVYFCDFYVIVTPMVLYHLYKKIRSSYVGLGYSSVFILFVFSSYFYSVYMTVHGFLIGRGEIDSGIYRIFFLEN